MKKSKQFIYSLVIAILLYVVTPNSALAQQDPGFTQYMYNTLSVNSAYAGTKEAINVILLSRHQWVGFEGAPQTQTFTIHSPVLGKSGLGVGLSYVRDQIGPLTVDNFFADAAYRFTIHKGGTLSVGVKAGFDMRKNNLTKLDPLSGTDPAYAQDAISKLTPNFGAGLYYYTDHYYFGFSTPKISTSDLSTDPSNPDLQKESLARHYFLIGGYVHQLNEDVKFKPSFYAKLVKGAPISFDMSLSLMFKERLITGLTYRLGDALSAMVQVRAFQYMWIGYAFDYSTTQMRHYNNGTHEIMIYVDMNTYKKDIIKSPRFF